MNAWTTRLSLELIIPQIFSLQLLLLSYIVCFFSFYIFTTMIIVKTGATIFIHWLEVKIVGRFEACKSWAKSREATFNFLYYHLPSISMFVVVYIHLFGMYW